MKSSDINSNNTGILFLGFLIWPFAGLIMSLLSYKTKGSNIVIVLFCALFGFTFIIPDQTVDSNRLIEHFLLIHEQPFYNFFNVVSGLYSNEDIKPDFVLTLINFLISRFTKNPDILFLGLAIIFSIFLLIFSNEELFYAKKSSYGWIYFTLILIFLPIYTINQFRFYSALLVFLIGISRYYKKETWGNFLIIVFSSFFHFSMILGFLAFIIVKFGKDKTWIYYSLLIISFLINDTLFPYLKSFNEQEIGSYEMIVRGYTSDSYVSAVEIKTQNTMSLLLYYSDVNRYFFIFLLIFSKLKKNYLDSSGEKLFNLCIVILSIVVLFESVDAVSSRYSHIFCIIASMYLLRVLIFNNKRLYAYLLIPILIINLIINFRYLIEFTNINLITPLSLISVFYTEDISILDIIKK